MYWFWAVIFLLVGVTGSTTVDRRLVLAGGGMLVGGILWLVIPPKPVDRIKLIFEGLLAVAVIVAISFLLVFVIFQFVTRAWTN